MRGRQRGLLEPEPSPALEEASMKNKWIIAGVSVLLCAAGAAARSYNPMKWIKFNCLKWDLTAVKPGGDVKSCEAPFREKAMNLSKAIRVLKPDADARNEAKNAEKRAREDIKDASS